MAPRLLTRKAGPKATAPNRPGRRARRAPVLQDPLPSPAQSRSARRLEPSLTRWRRARWRLRSAAPAGVVAARAGRDGAGWGRRRSPIRAHPQQCPDIPAPRLAACERRLPPPPAVQAGQRPLLRTGRWRRASSSARRARGGWRWVRGWARAFGPQAHQTVTWTHCPSQAQLAGGPFPLSGGPARAYSRPGHEPAAAQRGSEYARRDRPAGRAAAAGPGPKCPLAHGSESATVTQAFTAPGLGSPGPG